MLAGEEVVRVGGVEPMLVGEDNVQLVGAHSKPLAEAVPHRLPRRRRDEPAPSNVERVGVALCES